MQLLKAPSKRNALHLIRRHTRFGFRRFMRKWHSTVVIAPQVMSPYRTSVGGCRSRRLRAEAGQIRVRNAAVDSNVGQSTLTEHSPCSLFHECRIPRHVLPLRLQSKRGEGFSERTKECHKVRLLLRCECEPESCFIKMDDVQQSSRGAVVKVGRPGREPAQNRPL